MIKSVGYIHVVNPYPWILEKKSKNREISKRHFWKKIQQLQRPKKWPGFFSRNDAPWYFRDIASITDWKSEKINNFALD